MLWWPSLTWSDSHSGDERCEAEGHSKEENCPASPHQPEAYLAEARLALTPAESQANAQETGQFCI